MMLLRSFTIIIIGNGENHNTPTIMNTVTLTACQKRPEFRLGIEITINWIYYLTYIMLA